MVYRISSRSTIEILFFNAFQFFFEITTQTDPQICAKTHKKMCGSFNILMKFHPHKERKRDNNIGAEPDGHTACLLTLVKRNHNPLGAMYIYRIYI